MAILKWLEQQIFEYEINETINNFIYRSGRLAEAPDPLPDKASTEDPVLQAIHIW